MAAFLEIPTGHRLYEQTEDHVGKIWVEFHCVQLSEIRHVKPTVDLRAKLPQAKGGADHYHPSIMTHTYIECRDNTYSVPLPYEAVMEAIVDCQGDVSRDGYASTDNQKRLTKLYLFEMQKVAKTRQAELVAKQTEEARLKEEARLHAVKLAEEAKLKQEQEDREIKEAFEQEARRLEEEKAKKEVEMVAVSESLYGRVWYWAGTSDPTGVYTSNRSFYNRVGNYVHSGGKLPKDILLAYREDMKARSEQADTVI